jgi:hypothetical protein
MRFADLILEAHQCGFGSETVPFPCKFAYLRIADWETQGNFRICDERINHYQLTDL